MQPGLPLTAYIFTDSEMRAAQLYTCCHQGIQWASSMQSMLVMPLADGVSMYDLAVVGHSPTGQSPTGQSPT